MVDIMILPRIFSRPGLLGLLYKHLRDSIADLLIHPFPLTTLRRRHAQMVRDSFLTLIGLGGADLPHLGFFLRNFFLRHFSFARPTLTINILM